MRTRARRGRGPGGAGRPSGHPGLLGLALVSILSATLAHAAQAEPLVLESKIPLGDVKGRIDHLAVDAGRERLYVAELGNGSVGVVDLKKGSVIRRLTGFHEPQGIAYEAGTDTVHIANGGDGSVRVLHGSDLTPTGAVELGADADNVRIDSIAHHVIVGYGSGALAVIDPITRTKLAEIPLKAHPESFQLETNGNRIFVNVPDAREIAVVDRAAGKQTASWPTRELRKNFPLAIDEAHQRVWVMFRDPAKLGALSMRDGSLLTALDACGDADDLFVDSKRGRVYVTCGEGFIDVFAAQDGGYVKIARVATSPGARTALFVPALDRLFLAVRATAQEKAAVWIFRTSS
jgi:DNA-binding beta-propeller fold protein YncE